MNDPGAGSGSGVSGSGVSGSGVSGGADGRPSPQAARALWMDACARAGWRAAPAAEQVPVAAGLGRVTAGPVHARWPSPRADCAAMDGIAVAASALGDPVPGGPVRLPGPAFTWIDTGDPMPAGADTVVERERVCPQPDGGAAITGLTGPVPRGRNVRAAGEDFQSGQVLVPAGRRLRPADLAAAAAGGHAALAVARQPAVAIIPTGDEIRPVGSTLRHGEIVDSNSVMLAARCRQAGALPLVSDVQPDDPDALAAGIRRSALAADVVLVIAGSSRGRDDHTADVLAQVGSVAVAGAAVRPGHPVLLGHIKLDHARARQPAGIVPVVGLPGYPLATAVIFELFALPVLAALQGWQRVEPAQRAVLARDWASPPAVEDWVPVTLTGSPAGVLATPARRGAGSVSQLAGADAWWRIPAGQGNFTVGSVIEVLPVPGPGTVLPGWYRGLAPYRCIAPASPDLRGEVAVLAGCPAARATPRGPAGPAEKVFIRKRNYGIGVKNFRDHGAGGRTLQPKFRHSPLTRRPVTAAPRDTGSAASGTPADRPAASRLRCREHPAPPGPPALNRSFTRFACDGHIHPISTTAAQESHAPRR